MKILCQYIFQHRIALIISLVSFLGQQSGAQTYLNINLTNSTNKYSLLTDVRSITFDGSGGIVFKKTDNSISTETMTLLKNITLDGTSGGGAALPVELVSFTAVSNGGNSELKWKTATERNNYGFEIEKQFSNYTITRSQNSLWEKAGFVEGHGTTNAPKEYSFIDRTLNGGKYLYRLKQIDRDGKFEYSQQVEVTVTGAPKEFVLEQNYPNPFNPSTSIRYQLSVNGLTSLIIYDALGREIAVLVREYKEAGTYSSTFDA
ncbi:MAG: hypothetical protein ACOYNS_10170, partial [Bacteroidota bacterium]